MLPCGSLFPSRCRGSLPALALLGVLSASYAGDADAAAPLRCGSQVVSEGMDMAAVAARCGEPDDRDVWPPLAPGTPGWQGPVEEWTYNFGGNQLLLILRFVRGELSRIDNDGYGFAADAPPSCDAALRRGTGRYRLRQACGAPQRQSAEYGWQPRLFSPRGPAALQLIRREQWRYDFGPQRLPRRVDFEDARVTDVEVLMRTPAP